ncbi:MAG: hypothetical protein HRT65_16190 [Flavobacteriaceae bacterium]|nr:hypothetical protein [Flavobacteriaceae bacterium]
MEQKDQNPISEKDNIILFFFGIFFVLLLGRHYFANLKGSPEQKNQLLKWYYLGLVFWCLGIGGLIYLNRDALL